MFIYILYYFYFIYNSSLLAEKPDIIVVTPSRMLKQFELKVKFHKKKTNFFFLYY